MFVHTLYSASCNASMTLIFIVRSVRMSLIFSIIRITPSSTLLRHITLAAAALIFIFWATMIGLQTWWCMDHTILSGDVRPSCMLPRSILIFQVASKYFNECRSQVTNVPFMLVNCVADALSLIFSLKLLWRVKLPTRQRRMILYLFLTSRFLCLFSLAHSIAQLEASQSIQDILANLQVIVLSSTCLCVADQMSLPSCADSSSFATCLSLSLTCTEFS